MIENIRIGMGKAVFARLDASALTDLKVMETQQAKHPVVKAICHALSDAVLAAIGEQNIFVRQDKQQDDPYQLLTSSENRMHYSGCRIINCDTVIDQNIEGFREVWPAIQNQITQRLFIKNEQCTIKFTNLQGVDANLVHSDVVTCESIVLLGPRER